MPIKRKPGPRPASPNGGEIRKVTITLDEMTLRYLRGLGCRSRSEAIRVAAKKAYFDRQDER